MTGLVAPRGEFNEARAACKQRALKVMVKKARAIISAGQEFCGAISSGRLLVTQSENRINPGCAPGWEIAR